MNITCECGHEYQSKMAPPPPGEQGITLVCRYAENAHVCPECGTDNTPDLSKGVRETIGTGSFNAKSILQLPMYGGLASRDLGPGVGEALESIGFADSAPPQVGPSLEEVRERRFSEPEKPAEPKQIMWSATERVGIGIDNPSRIRVDEEGNTVLMPTSEGDD